MFDLQKVTIQSNKNGAGGYTLFTPKDNYANFPTKKFLLANMIISMGGRAAEAIYSNKNKKETKNYKKSLLFPQFDDLDVTTGASNDLKQVNSIARKYVSLFCLGEQIGLYDSSDGSQPFLGRELASGGSKISEHTKLEIDKEVKYLVNFAYNSALDIIQANTLAFEEMVYMLVDSQTLNTNDLNNFKINYK